MEQQLELEDILLDGLSNISEAFVIYGKNGNLVRCNDKFRSLYNYTKQETSFGVHFSTLSRLDLERHTVAVEDDEFSATGYASRNHNWQKTKKSPFVIQLKDKRWIKITDSPLNSGGIISIQSDITDLKLNESLLKKAKQQAEISDRAKSEFMANMSHELRTPLNAIIGFSSLLKSEIYGPHSDQRYKEYAKDIEGAGEHLLSLINEVLDLEKIETGSVVLNEEQVSVSDLCKSCLTLIGARARELNIKIEIDVIQPSLILLSDPIRLKQIVVNLVSNAVKFSHKNSSVFIDWSVKNGKVILRVKDSGVGIEREFLPLLYEPFQRSQIAKNLQREGTGLGLTLVKRFSDAHDATLFVVSEPDVGTTFEIVFPEYRSQQCQTILVP